MRERERGEGGERGGGGGEGGERGGGGRGNSTHCSENLSMDLYSIFKLIHEAISQC